MADEDEPVYLIIQIKDKHKARAMSLLRHAIHNVSEQKNIRIADTPVYPEGRGRSDGEVWYDRSVWEVIDNTFRFLTARARELADTPVPGWRKRRGR